MNHLLDCREKPIKLSIVPLYLTFKILLFSPSCKHIQR